MVRHYKEETARKQPNQQLFYYRNGLYQGKIDKVNGKREGKGIIYLTDNHQFIASNEFLTNEINGHSFFLYSHSRYHYGKWKRNKPHGVTVFRRQQTLVITEFQQGTILQNSKTMIVFERYNLGVLLTKLDVGWVIQKTQQILSVDDLQKLIDECCFKNNQERVFHSLVKYLNNCMVAQKKQMIKLRLLNDVYYRFGFDEGLAAIFDDSFRLKTIGVHQKSALTSYGISYHSQQLNNKLQEGIFDGYNTFTFNQKNKPVNQISKLYYRHLLTELNFKNQIFKDPAVQYVNFFQSLLKEPIIQELVPKKKQKRQIIREETQFLPIMKEPILQSNATKKYELLELKQLSMPTFKKQDRYRQSVQSSVQHLKRYNIENNNSVKVKGNENDTIEFESLNQKQKLQILKKQLYENVNHKQGYKDEGQSQREPRRSRLIHMDPVHIKPKNMGKTQHLLQQAEVLNEKLNSQIQLKRNIKDIQEEGNLKKKIQIKIKNAPQKMNSESNSRSKSRKKIFQQYTNIKRNYSPDTQVSPFKSRIKHKIFDKTPSKLSRSKSRTHYGIFSNAKQLQKKQTGKFYVSKSKNELFNMHEQNEKVLSKNQSSSYIKTFPVTMNISSNDKQNSVSSEKKIHKEITSNNKTNISKYIQINNYDRVNVKRQTQKKSQTPKKSNQIYRNDIKSSHGQYIYQPINIKQTGNKPYVANNASLSKNSSKKNFLIRDQSKKSIEQTSPLKKQKMAFYMNDGPQEYRKAERLSDFKRKVNYF